MTQPPCPSRSDALLLMQEFTASDSLRKHMYSVEAAMRAYAAIQAGDVERWGIAGLLHDFDYERWPNAAHSATEEHLRTASAFSARAAIPRTSAKRFLATPTTAMFRASRRWPKRCSRWTNCAGS